MMKYDIILSLIIAQLNTCVSPDEKAAFANDLVSIGIYGGDLGYSMMIDIILRGLSLEASTKNAEGGNRKLILNFKNSMYSDAVEDMKTEFGRCTDEVLASYNSIAWNRITVLAHELGHALIEIYDPNNVSLVQNVIAESLREHGFRELHRTIYSEYPVYIEGKKVPPFFGPPENVPPVFYKFVKNFSAPISQTRKQYLERGNL